MKKILILTLTILLLTSTACGSASNSTDAVAATQIETAVAQIVSNQLTLTASAPTAVAAATSVPSATLTAEYPNAASISEQLMAGTFLMENTNLAVTAEQAATLIPLWTSLKSVLQTSANEADANAIVQQIERAMTPEQIAAVSKLQLTRESLVTALHQKGMATSKPQQNAQSGPGANDGGTPPQGTPPAGGGHTGGGAPSAAGSGQTMGTQQNEKNILPPELIDALIQLLQKKIAS